MGDSDIETIQADVVNDDGILVIDEETAAPHGQPCDSCGAPVEAGDRFCGSCGAPSLEELPDVVDEDVVDDGDQADRFLRCDNCGSEVRVDPDQRSYSCPFCESTVVVEFSPDLSTRQRPEFVIGFALNREEAAEKFRQWLANDAWYRPKDLNSATLSELRGVYVPFWNFSMLADSNWDASIGEYWYRTETYTTTDSKGNRQTKTRRVRETEWWPLSGRHHRYHSGYLVSGSKGLPQALADRMMPFQLPALKRYQPYFLAGWLSEEYSVERAAALQQCQRVFYDREKQNVAAFLPGDSHRSLAVRTSFSAIQSDLCLLPVYLLTYTYKQKVYRFCINGQTGKIAGEKPTSWSRVMWTIVMFLAIGAGIAGVIALINFLMQR